VREEVDARAEKRRGHAARLFFASVHASETPRSATRLQCRAREDNAVEICRSSGERRSPGHHVSSSRGAQVGVEEEEPDGGAVYGAAFINSGDVDEDDDNAFEACRFADDDMLTPAPSSRLFARSRVLPPRRRLRRRAARASAARLFFLPPI